MQNTDRSMCWTIGKEELVMGKSLKAISMVGGTASPAHRFGTGSFCRSATSPAALFSVFQANAWAVWFRMALVRILVDGYSLLHSWPELAPGRARHSAAARDELVRRLTLYQDATGTPVTVFFDGGGLRTGRPNASSRSEAEVLYSRKGQTADQMIERAVHRFGPYGEVLAVTDDNAERDTVISLGGSTASCWNFIQDIENALAEMGDDIKHHNRRERHRFQRRK
jgi:uncharacterized protein